MNERSRWFVGPTLAVALLLLVACRPDNAVPSATPLATDSPVIMATTATEAEPATVEPAPIAEATVPLATGGVYPTSVETGLIDVDNVIAAALSGDPQQLLPLLGLLTAACTTAEGLGGPPKCSEGQPEGTDVTVFPILGSEGGFLREDELDEMLETLDIRGLYGAYIVSPEAAEESYWPAGDYGLVFTGGDVTPAYTFLMERGRIVRIVYHMGQSPAEAFDSNRGEIILAPME